MPLSPYARSGLRAAAAWNRTGALDLLGILRERPDWVAHKDDPYGPIHLIFNSSIRRRGGLKPEGFPVERLANCRAFGDEWAQRRFTKYELAAALEEVINELDRIG
jgi:hypothetical protein